MKRCPMFMCLVLTAYGIAEAVGGGAHASVALGPPPPIATPPIDLPGVVISLAAPAAVLTGPSGQSVQIDFREVRARGLLTVHDARRAPRVLLATGDTLQIDGTTEAGEYLDSRGDLVTVLGKGGLPRSYEAVTFVRHVFGFSAVCSRRVGVLMVTDSDSATAAVYLRAIKRRGYSAAIDDDMDIMAFECGNDCPTNGEIGFSMDRRVPATIAWFSYGEPAQRHLGYAGDSGLAWEGRRAVWRASRAPARKQYPSALTPGGELEPGALILIGAVRVDSNSGAIQVAK